MHDEYIPYGHQSIDDNDIEAVIKSLRSLWLTQGPIISEFEQAISKRVASRYAVAVSSGTAALHCAAFAAGVRKGDEIITSPNTFAASGNCARFLGADVKFVDIKPETFCMDSGLLEAAITERTKAIIPVDFAGQPCDMDEINDIAKKNGLTVIEDAAHSLGAEYKRKPVGSLAAMTIFSFHPVKLITTGEGGMIVTNDDELKLKLRMFRSHGTTKGEFTPLMQPEQGADNENIYSRGINRSSRAKWYYEMQLLGFNYRITDIQCALGLSQLAKIDQFISRRREIAGRYTEAFKENPYIEIPFQESDRLSAWHLYIIKLRLDKMKSTRRRVFEELRNMNIGAHVHYIPLHLHPYYRKLYGHKRGDFPITEKFYDSALTLPIYPGLEDKKCERIIESVLNILR